jgi:phage tail sheath protein FI
VTVVSSDGSSTSVWSNVPLNPNHKSAFGNADSLGDLFDQEPASLAQARTLPIVVLTGDNIDTGRDLFQALAGTSYDSLITAIGNFDSTDTDRTVEALLAGGNDGQMPTANEYVGQEDPDTNRKSGLVTFEDLEDISIVGAPGATASYDERETDANATINALITHAQKMRYRIAVLDSGEGLSISEVRSQRAKMDSSYAALYYPWVRVLDPVTNTEINLPPSGFVAGIYARNDTNRAVYKAPANEVVNGAIGFEKLLNKAQQEVLNPEGINCFRFFEGRGFRLWGARTISSDPEWKYVNLRRYFAYLEHSIDKGTQWAVFEPNGEMLWGNVRRTIEDFLLNEWQNGALLGDKPEKAYFVKCDRSTMSQNDLDNGRLVCLIGVAPLRPAEFVIFRIGQWTADRKV